MKISRNVNLSKYFSEHIKSVENKAETMPVSKLVFCDSRILISFIFCCLALFYSIGSIYKYSNNEHITENLIGHIVCSSLFITLLFLSFLLILTDFLLIKKDRNKYVQKLILLRIIRLPTKTQLVEFGRYYLTIREKQKIDNEMKDILRRRSIADENFQSMNGYDFEAFCCRVLRKYGFTDVQQTKLSGDHGADIICKKDGKTIAVQCKHWDGPVGNSAVQEVYAGAAYYKADEAIVISNSSFTKGAIELANSINVELIDGNKLRSMVGSNGDGKTGLNGAYELAFHRYIKVQSYFDSLSDEEILERLLLTEVYDISSCDLKSINKKTSDFYTLLRMKNSDQKNN